MPSFDAGFARRLAAATVTAAVVAGCSAVGFPGPKKAQVPPGHMPPPGQCRIWFPDRPPGHQPPPGPCDDLRHRVPLGAYLVRG